MKRNLVQSSVSVAISGSHRLCMESMVTSLDRQHHVSKKQNDNFWRVFCLYGECLSLVVGLIDLRLKQKIEPTTTWYFESLKCVIFPMPKHDSYAQNSSRVCTSITITFPTVNAPF